MEEYKIEERKCKRIPGQVVPLQAIAARSVAVRFSKRPKEYIKNLEKIPHLVPDVIAEFSPYFIEAYWTLYSHPTFKQYIPYWKLVETFRIYELAHIHYAYREKGDKSHPPTVPKPLPKWKPSLIDVYSEYNSFLLEPLSNFDKYYPSFYFSPRAPYRPSAMNPEKIPSIVTHNEFMERFDIFTNYQFEGWNDWKGMVVVGGAVFAPLMRVPPEFAKSTQGISNFFHKIAYTQSDIDVFFYGLSDEEIRRKILKFYEHLREFYNDITVLRTPFTITFCTKFPSRHIQMVLVKWKAVEEILYNVDVDCSALAFDGKKVWTSYRGRLSINKRWIVGCQEGLVVRGSPGYEKRLVKYSRRGFSIVDKDLRKWDLVKEKVLKEFSEIIPRPNSRMRSYGFAFLLAAVKYPEMQERYSMFSTEKFKDSGLPYGPKWNAYLIRKKVIAETVKEEDGHYSLQSAVFGYVRDIYAIEISTRPQNRIPRLVWIAPRFLCEKPVKKERKGEKLPLVIEQ